MFALTALFTIIAVALVAVVLITSHNEAKEQKELDARRAAYTW